MLYGYHMVTCSMTSRDLKRSRSWPRYIWSQISRKRLEIEARFQWSTNRKPHMGNRIVTWPMTSRDVEKSRSWPYMFRAQYFESGWRQTVGYNGAPMGNAIWGITWSHARWRHMTPKGEGRDPDIWRVCWLLNVEINFWPDTNSLKWTTVVSCSDSLMM